MSEGKNVELNRVRAALRQNNPGQFWNLSRSRVTDAAYAAKLIEIATLPSTVLRRGQVGEVLWAWFLRASRPFR
jgi:hypothetical protein